VSLVTKPHDDKQLFAMKTIDRFRLHNAMLRKSVANEISVLRRLSDEDTRHSGIAALIEVIETPRSIHLVIEFGGPSCHELLMRDGPLAEADARSVGGQIADALAHCHALAVCHRDVKLENIVVHERRAKLIDFGLSCVWHEGMVPLRRLAGSLPYMPPEMAHLVAGRKRPPLRAREEQPESPGVSTPRGTLRHRLGAHFSSRRQAATEGLPSDHQARRAEYKAAKRTLRDFEPTFSSSNTQKSRSVPSGIFISCDATLRSNHTLALAQSGVGGLPL
jgi:hypothetical protein